MSIIKDFRALYGDLPKPEQNIKQPALPANQELMDKAINNLSKQPLVAPNICRKPE